MKKLVSLLLLLWNGHILQAQNCTANFSWEDSDITVEFHDLSTSDSNDPIISWLWDFDDNNAISTLQNPTYTFSEPGSYNVSLEISTQNGCTEDITYKIRTCVLLLNLEIGGCNSSGMIPVTLEINDNFDSAEEVDVIIDGQSLLGGPFPISITDPLVLNTEVAGNGLFHQILVTSTERENCTSSMSFQVPDCNSDCFLSSLEFKYPEGDVHTVNIGDNFFNPASTGIVLGDIVLFNWIDGGHSSTSDATSGSDTWNSGILNAGSQIPVQIKNPGTHRYYCIPHGGPGGVGMSGSILANCPDGTQMDLVLNFSTSVANIAGYNIRYDGSFMAGGPFNYSGIGAQSKLISIAGDGISHSIEIVDVSDPSCTLSSTFLAPDCKQGGGEPICSINFEVGEPSACLDNQNVDVPIQVNMLNGSDGFNISIDGNASTFYTYTGPTTNIIVSLPGDGNVRNIVISDNQKQNCSASLAFTSPDCSTPCTIQDLTVVPFGSNENGEVHQVNVEDFQFNPKVINISEGDRVEWNWTGDIPHSTTSDANSGANSWNSDVIGKGSSFISPTLSIGEHPYYCIPHGGPGGQGMSGKIFVLPPCSAQNEVSILLRFLISNKRGTAFDVKVDGSINASFDYVAGDIQQAIIKVSGDGTEHSIEIIDDTYSTCSQMTSIVTADCDAGEEPVCAINIDEGVLGSCIDLENELDLNISAINQSDSFELMVDGSVIGHFPFQGSNTLLSILIAGDGLQHTIGVADLIDKECLSSFEIISEDCSLPCTISNIKLEKWSANPGGTTHVVFVEDYQFNPKEIEIIEGDKVEWKWTGQIAHTSTSDATTGPDSWGSDLLTNGANFISPALSKGEHPYYCVPHGGPGGQGMSGNILVRPECNDDNETPYSLSFAVSGKGTMGFSIIIDEQMPLIYNYNEGIEQEIVIMLPGDGNMHSVAIIDNENQDCINITSLLTIACNPENCEGAIADFDTQIDYESNEIIVTNLSSGNIISYLWDFGDGSTSSEINPSYQYQDTGSYTICLSIEDDQNCTTLSCKEIFLDQNICEASFDFIQIGNKLTFINKSKISNSNYSLEWDLGNGDIFSEVDTLDHAFSAGLFDVCINISSLTCNSTYCETFDFTNPCDFVLGRFSYEINPLNGGIQFTNESQETSSWIWGFGDGITSEEFSPHHVYAEAGSYNVCLLAQNVEKGCTSVHCEVIDVIFTNVHEVLENDYIVVVPNPQVTGQSISVKGLNYESHSGTKDVLIYSIDGKKKFEERMIHIDHIELPAHFEAGLYYLRIVSSSKIYTTSFVLIDDF